MNHEDFLILFLVLITILSVSMWLGPSLVTIIIFLSAALLVHGWLTV